MNASGDIEDSMNTDNSDNSTHVDVADSGNGNFSNNGNDNSVNTDNSDNSTNVDVADSGNGNFSNNGNTSNTDNSDNSTNVDVADSGNGNFSNNGNDSSVDSSTTTMVVTSMELAALATGITVDAHGFKEGEVRTGDVSIDNGALQNFGGINTASMNTGIGSANQAATAVGANANISFGNGGTP